MKILESRPERYDLGINILSGGHAKKIKNQIIHQLVKPDIDVLDLGCGTGSFIVQAAKQGAHPVGIDISSGMLEVAKKRLDEKGLSDKVSLYHGGVVEIDSIFNEKHFDLIISTLVFSELYYEERSFAFYQIKKLLKPGSILVIAVETQPKTFLKKLFHSLVRFPLEVLTYLVAQTGTKPLRNLVRELTESGFQLMDDNRSFFDSFTIISAKVSTDTLEPKHSLPQAKKPIEDYSLVKSIWDFIERWFPNPVEPGLLEIGNPNRQSPVILTSNFHLTVRRVENSLKKKMFFSW